MPKQLERDVDADVRRALAALPDVSVFPNECGTFRTLDGKRVVRCGLGTGSADLVGIVGPHGRWFAVELKRPRGAGARVAQRAWLALMRKRGAAVGIARSVADALAIVEQARAER